LELACRVFSEFRQFALSTPTIQALARTLPSGPAGDRLKVIAAICLPGSDFEKRKPTLGEMAYIIDKSNAPTHALWEEFRKWVAAKFPQLLRQAKNLMTLNAFRRLPAHGNIPKFLPEGIPPLCRRIIDSLSPPEK
jgi:hypothetical protein